MYVDKVVEVEKIVEKPVEVIKYVEVPVVEKHEVRVPVPVQTNSWEQVTRGSVQLPVNYQARSIGLNDRVSGYSEQTVTMPRSPNRSSVVYNGSAPPLYTDGGSVLRNNDFYTTMRCVGSNLLCSDWLFVRGFVMISDQLRGLLVTTWTSRVYLIQLQESRKCSDAVSRIISFPRWLLFRGLNINLLRVC